MKTCSKVVGLNLKDKTQVCFNSAKDAADYLNLDYSHILKCIKGSRKTHGGYSWSVEKLSEERVKILFSDKKESTKNLGSLVKIDSTLFSDLEFIPEEWSREEDEVIERNYPYGNLQEIVTKTARDVTAITLRAKFLGLKRMRIQSKNRSAMDLMNILVDSKNEETLS